jgi:hypothetical protein
MNGKNIIKSLCIALVLVSGIAAAHGGGGHGGGGGHMGGGHMGGGHMGGGYERGGGYGGRGYGYGGGYYGGLYAEDALLPLEGDYYDGYGDYDDGYENNIVTAPVNAAEDVVGSIL